MPYRDQDQAREHSRESRKAQTRAGQDLADKLWPIKNPARRKRGLAALRRFAETYFPARFDKPFCEDHERVIALLEQAVRTGGLVTIAMPRGSGKTALTIVAAIWALLSGARQYVLLIGSEKAAGVELLDAIKAELETKEVLAEDFPREVGPFKLLEGEARACTGQRYRGTRTYIRWRADTIVCAAIPGSKAAGGIIRVAGLTGRLRGASYTREADGRVVRPDFAIADDPQTDESARSASQTATREKILDATVRGLAGPGQRIALVAPVTVIQRGDLADRLFDRTRHPQWDGVRMKALYSFPTNMRLWEEYAEIYRAARERGKDGREATDFYAAHRAEMDLGAKVAWPARYEPGQLSAVQFCMDLFLFARATFMAEYQNEPEEEVLHSGRVTAEAVLAKLNGRPRGQVPKRCRWILAHVDVHDEILYWHVLAVEPGYTCYTIDYGTWPGQPQRYFAQDHPPLGLSRVYTGRSKEGAIVDGLRELLEKHLLVRRYAREDAGDLPIDLVGVDAGYKPEEVAQVIRAVAAGNRVWPTKGFGIGPAKKPFTEYKPEQGVLLGRHWRKAMTKATGMLTLEIDANRWKSFTRDRIAAPRGNPASWSLFGADPREHQLLADHLAVEIPVEVSGPYGKMEQWTVPPARPDQHWWDDLVSCLVEANAVAAGAKLPEWESARPRAKGQRKAVSYL